MPRDPLSIQCPKCKAPAGEPCRNYKGQRKQACPPRQRERQDHAGAAKRNKAAREAAPLFADLFQEVTPAQEHWRWMRNNAMGAEHAGRRTGGVLLGVVQVMQTIRPFAKDLLGLDTFQKLDAYCFRVFHASDYWYSFWKRVLTGERIELMHAPIPDLPPGKYGSVCTDWYEHQHMTAEEFYARFPYQHAAPLESGFEKSVPKLEIEQHGKE